MTVMHACTIVARNYLAQAQVLVDSFRQHHPDGTFDVVLIDDAASERPSMDGADILMLDEIGLAPADLSRMAAIYELIELATAVKPWTLMSLLDRGYDHAVYFDPDISIERPIDELPALAREHSVVLTPHLTEPMPRDGGAPSEQAIMLSGTYNLGFVGVGNTHDGRAMLDWWRTRLRSDAVVDVANGFFTDQRFIDLVPGLFDHVIVKDPSWNAAYWNLATRPLTRGPDGRILISGRPPTFIHYSGYSPQKPYLLSKHQGPEPRLKLSEHPLLRELCDDYGERLKQHGFVQRQADFTLPFTTLDGVELDPLSKKLVRAELLAIDNGERSDLRLGQETGLPLEEWLDSPSAEGRFPWLTRYLEELYLSRVDLRKAYPEVRSGRITDFLEWVEVFGVAKGRIAQGRLDAARRLSATPRASLLLSRPAEPVDATTPRHGVEVAGYLTADLGLGESGRQFVASLELAGLPVSTTTYTNTLSRLGAPWVDRQPQGGLRNDIALVCVNADQLPRFTKDAGSAYLKNRYRIGLWFWELDDFPKRMRKSARLLDEIWVCSEFNRAAIAAHTDRPVKVVPHPAHAPAFSDTAVEEVPADDVFTYLFVFDYLSVFQRKNPAGLVEAFLKAHPQPGAARLVIKAINGSKRQQDQEHLRYLAAGRPDIVLIDRYLSRPELDYLMHRADCYVSLHRSEGFGQTLAEMMAIGKPVIATNYSGNLEFTRPDNSYLVPYAKVAVPSGADPYPTTARWAEPDLDEAARLMLQVRENPREAKERGEAAARTISEEFSNEALARVARARLEEIWASDAFARRTAPPAPKAAAPTGPAAVGRRAARRLRGMMRS
ncbi:glycosyltransferase [Nocardioides sp. BYT-33-1]|uniref:glycosyltransferase n=1 Tax=Nocardioides sp. BYT-33-1 TaxID=3416952 RepID=UPI003F5340CE